MASKVYFADFRCPSWRENLQQKLARLMMTAGFGDIDMDGKYVAIKMHFGEPGNMAYLRPNWAKTVADLVKSQGGKPFLTDCNTLYIGGRKNALDHMESAYVNGFTPYSTGCHIIIADGLKGNDEVAVPVEGGEYVKEAKIGRAVMDADVFISLTHFKGHEQAGFGGTLKNLGMGGNKKLYSLMRWGLDRYLNPVRAAIDLAHGKFSQDLPMPELVKKASEVTSVGVQAGEGWLLTAEILELIESGCPNVICAQPFACLPNHVTGRGMFGKIRRLHPDANIVSIDYDPGASQANQLNRIKLMIAAAKKNHQKLTAAD